VASYPSFSRFFSCFSLRGCNAAVFVLPVFPSSVKTFWLFCEGAGVYIMLIWSLCWYVIGPLVFPAIQGAFSTVLAIGSQCSRLCPCVVRCYLACTYNTIIHGKSLMRTSIVLRVQSRPACCAGFNSLCEAPDKKEPSATLQCPTSWCIPAQCITL
jgi:hypothetical protein